MVAVRFYFYMLDRRYPYSLVVKAIEIYVTEVLDSFEDVSY